MSRSSTLRLLVFILLLLLAISCAVFLFGTKEGHILRHHPRKLNDLVEAHRITIAIVFVAVYVVMGLVAMPVWWLQILSGYCFGLVGGIFMSQISSTLAAVATRNLAHWLAGAYVHEKLEARRAKLRQLDEKLGHNGLLVVMAVRLSHVIPFGLSNYLFGLSRISTVDVAIGSFLGGMPAASFYATIGSNRHLFKDWRYDVSLVCVNLLLLIPLLLRYLQPQWFKRIGVE
ncbi:MAG TPA: VTT domain-containing protein [Tepidisphaeraceae bacterium]|nr:VTT domain-containing protein [Tepidisphaeraceae bacterium]